MAHVKRNNDDSISIEDTPDEIHPRRIIGNLPRSTACRIAASCPSFELLAPLHKVSISESPLVETTGV